MSLRGSVHPTAPEVTQILPHSKHLLMPGPPMPLAPGLMGSDSWLTSLWDSAGFVCSMNDTQIIMLHAEIHRGCTPEVCQAWWNSDAILMHSSRRSRSDLLHAGAYTAFIYLEDDMPLRWHTLLSWAHDNTALEPMGLQRQFYRTEIAPWNGRTYMTDARGYTSLDKAISVSRYAQWLMHGF